MPGALPVYINLSVCNVCSMSTLAQRTRTNLFLDAELWHRLKVAAVVQRTTATSLVDKAVRRLLAHMPPVEPERRRTV